MLDARIDPAVHQACERFTMESTLGFGRIKAPLMYVAGYREGDGTEYPSLPADKPSAIRLRKALVDIQEGRAEDTFAWCHPVPEHFVDLAGQASRRAVQSG